MEHDIVDYLKCINYSGSLDNAEDLLNAAKSCAHNIHIRDLIVWLSKLLTNLIQLDSTVTAITENEDLANFLMELGSLLKELGCPYSDLIEGPLTERLATSDQCLRLLHFLISEVMAAKISRFNQGNSGSMIRVAESPSAKDLKSIMLALKLSRPPDNIASKDLFTKVDAKLREVASKAPTNLISKPLLNGRLSQNQWNELKAVQSELNQEYRLRREMLLKRLDVTIQSFEWSEKVKGQDNTLAQKFVEKRRQLAIEPCVALSDVIAARQDAAIIEKTSGSTARKHTTSSVHKVIIGRVPDRGGRPSEQDAPPPEMPSWQKERSQGAGGGGGGGGSFSGARQFNNRGGGRVQGGWNQQGGADTRNDDRDNKGYGNERRGSRGGRHR